MKRIYLIIFGLLTFLFASSQTANYEVYILKYASLANPSTASEQAKATSANDSMHVDFMVWLLKGNNGKNILVDAGFLYGVDEAKDFNGINYLKDTLQITAVQPQDITDIILSHRHVEDFDYKNAFPNAHVWIQKEDYNYYTQTSWQKGGTNAAFNRKSVQNLIDLNNGGRLTFSDAAGKEIIPGVKLYITPGEKFNSQYLVVKSVSDNIFLGSDNIWLYYNLEHAAAPTYGAFSAGSYIQALQMMKNLVFDVKFIPAGQDASLFSKFPLSTEGVIRIK
jgi:glyoxylase-like metal-dependent hydrolase (beta-lactamase superfamily II)